MPQSDQLGGLVELADRNQRLEVVTELQVLRRLAHEDVAELVRATQVAERLLGVSEGELEEAEHAEVPRDGDSDPERLTSLDAVLGPGSGVLDSAAMRGQNRVGDIGGRLVAELVVERGVLTQVRLASFQLPPRHSTIARIQRT